MPELPHDLQRPAHLTASDFEGFEAVVHLAELSNDPLGERRPEVTFAINHEGSVRIAQAARAAGVRRFVYASSCSVYGAALSIRLMRAHRSIPKPPMRSVKRWLSGI